MASSSSDTENGSCQTDDSDWNYIPGPHIISEPTEVETSLSEHNTASASAMSNEHDEEHIGSYADEPIADEEWLAKYREKKQSYDERLGILQRRLNGSEEVRKW